MRKQYQAVTAAEAVKVIKLGDHVHISSVSNVPQCLVKALCDRGRAGELKNVYIHHLHTEGAAPYVNPEFEGIFQHNAFFVGAVNLYGRSLQERAKLIISVAHPQFQEQLDEAAFKRFGSHFHYLWSHV